MVTAASCGALLGSSWATSLSRVASGRDSPTVTVVVDDRSLAMMVEYRQARILVLDSVSEHASRNLTETVAGFMTPRFDLLLATRLTTESLAPDFLNRWNVAALFDLSSTEQPSVRSAVQRSFRVEEMTLDADRHAAHEWQQITGDRRFEWHARVTFGSSQIVLATSLKTAAAVAAQRSTLATCLISNDLEAVAPPLGSAIIALPAETAGLEDSLSSEPEVVRLYRNRPTLFRMAEARIDATRSL
jgi:hypothetical protein